MRFLASTFFSTVFFTCSVLAQDLNSNATPTRDKFFSTFELFGGPNLSFLRGNVGVDNTSTNSRKTRNGFTIGVSGTHYFSKKVSLAINVIYENKGGVSETAVTYYDTLASTFKEGKERVEYTYHYYTLPILFEYVPQQKRGLHFGLGPFLSYLEKLSVTETYLFSGSINNHDLTSYSTKFDFGIAFRVGYIIQTRRGPALDIQLMNVTGLVNTLVNPNPGQVMNSNSTSLMIGMRFAK